MCESAWLNRVPSKLTCSAWFQVVGGGGTDEMLVPGTASPAHGTGGVVELRVR